MDNTLCVKRDADGNISIGMISFQVRSEVFREQREEVPVNGEGLLLENYCDHAGALNHSVMIVRSNIHFQTWRHSLSCNCDVFFFLLLSDTLGFAFVSGVAKILIVFRLPLLGLWS